MSDAILPVRPAMAGPRPGLPRPGLLPGARLTSALIITLIAASAIGMTGRRSADPEKPAPRAEAAAGPVWIDIAKPVHIYSLEARELAKLPATYAARRRSVGDLREDILGFGSWTGEQPSLRLSILRGTGESAPSLDTAIVRQAAAVGVAIGRSKIPETLPTRFGSFEVADVGGSGPGAALSCSGFRLALPTPAMALDGFACGAGGRPIPRHMLACLIDRLDLASAGEDRALVDFFAATDLRRAADCDGMRLAPDGVHAAWLDDKPARTAPAQGRSASRHRHHRH